MSFTVPHAHLHTGLLATGLTEPQAVAIVQASETIAARRIDAMRDEFARWHAYLALYLLMQIGIVLLIVSFLSFDDRRGHAKFAATDMSIATDPVSGPLSRVVQVQNLLDACE